MRKQLPKITEQQNKELEEMKTTEKDSIHVDLGVMRTCRIGYRHIPPEERMTPMMYLPMQRMGLEVAEPFGDEQVRDALIKYFGDDWFGDRYDITEIECEYA